MTFPQWLATLGIIPPEHIQPGRWTRCATESHPRKKNASIKLNEDETSGFAQDFASMSECAVWRIIDNTARKVERTAEQMAAMAERIALRRQEEIRGTMRAVAEYAKAEQLRNSDHEYLRRKRLTMLGARGFKVRSDGNLVVPMLRDCKIVSVQSITPSGEKRFALGAPTKGATFAIRRPGSAMTILTEGLATGLTLFESCDVAQVIVCFSAVNLIAVAEREDFAGMLCVAADNDSDTEERTGHNTGVEAAQRAAIVLGCGVAVPYSELGTDWNDLFVERLEKMEAENVDKEWPESPYALRKRALAPIKAAVMATARMIPVKEV